MTGKNLRLLGRERSGTWQPDIHEIIAALREELAKGAAVYTGEELDLLSRKLNDYLAMLERLTNP